eukprot:TRINITY_DN5057_c0_g3_i1.p5 TRINITY_DN5057_c0_g3~~TRINITY_DN5057_c0_g3_i1.p5  ORF type:complete len:102 (+),score=4.52 TRINITY_DN5057_c0_g3_i1:305-610(+)
MVLYFAIATFDIFPYQFIDQHSFFVVVINQSNKIQTALKKLKIVAVKKTFVICVYYVCMHDSGGVSVVSKQLKEIKKQVSYYYKIFVVGEVVWGNIEKKSN